MVLIRGAGDLATGAALSFHAAGFRVLMTEIPCPTAIRLTVSFAAAVYEGSHEVEGVRALLAPPSMWLPVLENGNVAVVVDPAGACAREAAPVVIVDAIMAKRNLGTARSEKAAVIALGPGFTAGQDADAVIETARGHALGRIIRDGSASTDTGVPGDIGGKSRERVLRAPADGRVTLRRQIGDLVKAGEVIMEVQGQAVVAPFDGCLRGAISGKASVRCGMKIGDVDPRGETAYVHTVSDKARAVGRAALEAALVLGQERRLFHVSSI
ncbi:MAG TPA: selenium-dependent molybdenum cofactor biosynthesis protein YqeB [Spirochaetia bacterium]|nr:selenium-dependent molybdenum cofactor biosynthesis protein YqeB [Spirochaetia bacterium]